MSDLELSTLDNDLLIENGDLSIVDGTDAIAQHLFIRLRSIRGDWFYDANVGIPYYFDIFTKNPSRVAVRSIFRNAITTTPGVLELQELETELNSRTLELEFTALLDGSDAPRDFSLTFTL